MLATFARYIIDRARSVARDEVAQDAFEYVLVIGVLVVAILLAVATPVGSTMIDAVVSGTCTAIDSLPNVTVSCA